MVQPYSHFIQYPSELELDESGTKVVQIESRVGKAPFSAASREAKKFDPGRRHCFVES